MTIITAPVTVDAPVVVSITIEPLAPQPVPVDQPTGHPAAGAVTRTGFPGRPTLSLRWGRGDDGRPSSTWRPSGPGR
jgi:hypothetical protein